MNFTQSIMRGLVCGLFLTAWSFANPHNTTEGNSTHPTVTRVTVPTVESIEKLGNYDETIKAQQALIQACQDKEIEKEVFKDRHNRLFIMLQIFRLETEIQELRLNLQGDYEKAFLRVEDEKRLSKKEEALEAMKLAERQLKVAEPKPNLFLDIHQVYAFVGSSVAMEGHGKGEKANEDDGGLLGKGLMQKKMFSKKMISKKGGMGFFGGGHLAPADIAARRAVSIFNAIEAVEKLLIEKACDTLSEEEKTQLESYVRSLSSPFTTSDFYEVEEDLDADEEVTVTPEEIAAELESQQRRNPYRRNSLLFPEQFDNSYQNLKELLKEKMRRDGDLIKDKSEEEIDKSVDRVLALLLNGATPAAAKEKILDRKKALVGVKRMSKSERSQRLQSALDNGLALLHHRARPDASEVPNFIRQKDREDVNAFTEKIGATKGASRTKEAVDLSGKYGPVVLQTPQCYSCVAFATLDDASFQEGIPNLSKNLGYALGSSQLMMLQNGYPVEFENKLAEQMQRLTNTDNYEQMQQAVNQGAPMKEFYFMLQKNPLVPEADYPYTPERYIPEEINAIPNRVYQVDSHAHLTQYRDGYVTPDNIRDWLASGVGTSVSIKTDARKTQEDWLRFEPVGSIYHAINVVGYGKGVDPFDGQEKDYFIVRDSLAEDTLHYKVSVEDFMDQYDGSHKVTGMKVLEEAPIYKSP